MITAAPTTRVMMVAILVSTVVFLDGTVVNLALPATARELGGGMCSQQWVVDGYLLAVAAMVLPGGAISDLFGRIPVLRLAWRPSGRVRCSRRPRSRRRCSSPGAWCRGWAARSWCPARWH